MDMSLSIERGKVISTIYEKKLALYLYIPPHSAHPPGVLTELIMGNNTLRIHQLCTNKDDIATKLEVFFNRLLDRDHQHKTLLPIFLKATENANTCSLRSEEDTVTIKEAKKEAAERSVYLHVPFHPNNPSSSTIQNLWRTHVAAPAGFATQHDVK